MFDLSESFQRTEYRGVPCFICKSAALRAILFPGEVVSYHIAGQLMFRSSTIFRDSRIRRHEYKHWQQWKKGGSKFVLFYTYFTLNRGYRKNPFEKQARRAEKKPGRVRS